MALTVSARWRVLLGAPTGLTSVRRAAAASGWAALAALADATPVLAHDGPDQGAEWLMADWMLLVFLVFFGAALAAFLFAWKRGLFHDLEAAKYHVLTVDEADYYTPEWAKEDGGAA